MENTNGTLQSQELDSVDIKIMDALREDGRIAFAQIAEQLNV